MSQVEKPQIHTRAKTIVFKNCYFITSVIEFL